LKSIWNYNQLVVNRYSDGNINLYIQDAGSFISTSGVEILFVFDESKTIYRVNSFNSSDDGKHLFLNGFKNPIGIQIVFLLGGLLLYGTIIQRPC
jgi:hypothetical protein